MTTTTSKFQKVKIVRKPSLPDTLKSLQIGTPYKMTNSEFKITAVRTKISELRKDKVYDFTISEAGMPVNEYVVTRIK